jgi:hypothetical protein
MTMVEGKSKSQAAATRVGWGVGGRGGERGARGRAAAKYSLYTKKNVTFKTVIRSPITLTSYFCKNIYQKLKYV